MRSVLIIDDEPQLRQMLVRLLSSEGIDVVASEDCKSGAKQLEQKLFNAVLCDVKLPDGNGVDFAGTIREKHPCTEVVVFTAYGNIADGVRAVKNGAFDYLVKGDDNNRIIPVLNHAIEKSLLQQKITALQKQLYQPYTFDSIIGKSNLIKSAVDLAKRVAPTETSVLLTGDTGCGKEVFAQAIHNASARAGKPFIALNCSSFSAEILESELFGHKAGAFTGAIKETKGLIEEANSGTLFLDEIAEMPLEIQAKFLRFLESGEYLKVGDSKLKKSNVRIIAATNKDIKPSTNKINFRSDLFYRIATFEIQLPALNHRKEDIALFVSHFINLFGSKLGKKINSFTPSFIHKLEAHQWSGNIRELRNIIERACILCDADILEESLLPLDFIIANVADNASDSLKLSEIEKQHIAKVLALTKGNKTKTAELLGIGLTTLYAKIKEYAL